MRHAASSETDTEHASANSPDSADNVYIIAPRNIEDLAQPGLGQSRLNAFLPATFARILRIEFDTLRAQFFSDCLGNNLLGAGQIYPLPIETGKNPCRLQGHFLANKKCRQSRKP
jgi:hypothetical protein